MHTHVLENEAFIVEQAKTNDAYFTELYNAYFPNIYAFIMKRTGHRETAEDLVSSIFTKVFHNLHRYEQQHCPFGAWIYRVATNELIDHYRREGRKKEVDVGEEFILSISDNAVTVPDSIDAHWEAEKVRKVLTKLKPRHQEIVQLKFFSELKNNEIAAVLDISENHVAVLLYRALNRFSKLYTSYE